MSAGQTSYCVGMDVAFAFDEGYADHVPVAVESILATHQAGVTLWLLTTAQVKAERAEAWQAQAAGRAKLHLLSATDEFRSWRASARESLSYISSGTYLRLLLPGHLPEYIDRVLYLDSDVLVCGDLSPLWDIPLDGAALAAVGDHFTPTLGTRDGIPGAPTDIDMAAPYFNSGVLMINLPVWRTLGITELCLKYMTENQDRLRLPDQDALNLAAYGRWHELAGIWNDHVSWWNPVAEPQDTRILHFIGRKKPWHDGFEYPAAHELYQRIATRVGVPAAQ